MQNPPTGVKVKLIDDNDLHKWEILMDGPEQSAYAVRPRPLITKDPLQALPLLGTGTIHDNTVYAGRTFHSPLDPPNQLPLQTASAQLRYQDLPPQYLQ